MAPRMLIQIGDKRVDLLTPTPDQMDIPAMRRKLSGIQRWGGDPDAWNVLQHSAVVEELCRLNVLDEDVPHDMDAALTLARVHDYPEAITGDMTEPVKQYLIFMGCFVFRDLERKLERVFLMAHHVQPGEAERAYVHTYDKLAGHIEYLYKMGKLPEKWTDPRATEIDKDTIAHLLEVAEKEVP